MKKKHPGVLVFCLLFVFMSLSIGARVNHYKLYVVKSAPMEPIVVTLQDQFDRGIHRAKLTGIAFFANPVVKWHGDAIRRIEVPNAHLTWYKFTADVKPRKRIVKIRNQFGVQKWVLGEAKYLVVPTQKLLRESSMPKEFNHFKAYQVIEGDFRPVVVKLKDQFDKEPIKVKVFKPYFFLNPVQKNKEPIYNKRYHLACYLIDPKGPPTAAPKSFYIRNQFGKKQLFPSHYFVLCVPTEKLGFE
jgi:hypothetical protein